MKSTPARTLLPILCLGSVGVGAGEIYGRADAPCVAEVRGTEIHTEDTGELRYVIVGKLIE